MIQGARVPLICLTCFLLKQYMILLIYEVGAKIIPTEKEKRLEKQASVAASRNRKIVT